MIKNYIKIAWRTIIQNKINSLINIVGLAIGMACVLFILLYVQDELNELKNEAATLDYLPMFMAYGFVLIDKKAEAVFWLNKSLDFGYSPYALVLNLEAFHITLSEQKGFQNYLNEIKERVEKFVI